MALGCFKSPQKSEDLLKLLQRNALGGLKSPRMSEDVLKH